MGIKILQVLVGAPRAIYSCASNPKYTHLPSWISLSLSLFFSLSTLTNQIKLRKIWIRPNIRTRNRRLKILDFGTLLRIEAFILLLITIINLQPPIFAPATTIPIRLATTALKLLVTTSLSCSFEIGKCVSFDFKGAVVFPGVGDRGCGRVAEFAVKGLEIGELAQEEGVPRY